MPTPQLLVSDSRDERTTLLGKRSRLGERGDDLSIFDFKRSAFDPTTLDDERKQRRRGLAVAISDLDVLGDLLRRHSTGEAGWELFRVAARVDHTAGGAAHQAAGQPVVAVTDRLVERVTVRDRRSCRSRFCSSLSSRWVAGSEPEMPRRKTVPDL